MKITNQIQAINNNKISRNRKNIASKASYSGSPLKNIPGNHCACCGNKMITSDMIAETWANITRPLREVFSDGLFSPIKSKYPTIYNVLCNFLAQYPEQSLDKIILDEHNHELFLDSVVCSFTKEELPEESRTTSNGVIKGRIMNILKLSERVLLDAPEVVEQLKTLQPYIRGFRKEILDSFEGFSKIYPNKKLSEILRMPRVIKLFNNNTLYDVMDFAAKRDEHWNNANEIILREKPELKNLLTKLDLDDLLENPELKEAWDNNIYAKICSLYRTENDPRRMSYMIKEIYRTLLEKEHLQYLEQSVMDELEQMPTELYTKNSFFSYARRFYADCGIVNYIIKPFVESEDHAVAVSKIKDMDTREPQWKKSNSIVNKLIMCRQCNIYKSSYPYASVAKWRPEIIPNTEWQLDFVAEQILDGNITDDIYYYPVEAAKWLKRNTDSQFIHNTLFYEEKLAEKYGFASYKECQINLGNRNQ